jgi:hypothetical protein
LVRQSGVTKAGGMRQILLLSRFNLTRYETGSTDSANRICCAAQTSLIDPMRDIFEDIFANQPLDPMEAARRNMRPNLRARF